MRVGFIGLGTMGASMALNAQKAKHELIVNDLRREAAAPHIKNGAVWADSPRAVAEKSEVILTSLPGPREVEAIADDRLVSGPSLSDLERMFDRKGVSRLALVGHEPSLSRTVAELTGTSGIAVEKGSLIRIDLPHGVAARAGRLIAVLPPSILRAPKEER